MSRWTVVTSEATLCRLALLFLFLKKASALETLDKRVAQSRRTWCEETKACARCEAKTRPRCFEGAEPILGGDICGCCTTCVAVRDSGESCGSQLSVLHADPVSALTILATTRCREGLVCLNSACHDLGANLKPATPILASHDDRREEETVYLTTKTQPCYANSGETVSYFPFDELLGRVATIDLDGKRFGIVYTGEFRKELNALLTAVDVSQDGFMLDEKSVESLFSGFFHSDLGNSESRNKRELDPPPENIQDILIRGASAHHEYLGGAQNQVPRTEISDRNTETVNQGDESTVQVHITTQPRKVQTLIDLEEGDDEGVGRVPPLDDEQERVSSRHVRPLPATVKTKEEPEGWNETLMALDDRLTLVEGRIDLFERVLEEMAKWCNLGVFSTRDCLVQQNSDLSFRRRGPDPEEQLALASALDAVRVPENRRRTPVYRGRMDTRRQNPFRAMINDGYLPRRRTAGGRWGLSTSSCKDRTNIRSTRDVTSANQFSPETQIPVPSWKMFIFDENNEGGEGVPKVIARAVRKIDKPKLFNEESEEPPLTAGNQNSAVRAASGRLLFRDSDIPELTTESGTEVTLISANPDQDSLATSYSITNHGNSRIQIEEIGHGDYESLSKIHEVQGPSSAPEDEFESVETEEEDVGFDYDTEPPLETWEKPETELKWGSESPRVFYGQERNRRDRRRRGKRETPLLLFGSTGRNDPKTILWPSKWAGYQRDRIQVAGDTGEETTADPGFEETTPASLITVEGIKGEGSHTVTPKTSGFERRGRKNRRKLVWR